MNAFICNAFSVNMLSEQSPTWVHVQPITIEHARDLAREFDAQSAVGHVETAEVFADLLRRPVEQNRTTLKLGIDDAVILGQYYGPRLKEGATRLPSGAQVKWFLITLDEGEEE
jgi:hypothetical protein